MNDKKQKFCLVRKMVYVVIRERWPRVSSPVRRTRPYRVASLGTRVSRARPRRPHERFARRWGEPALKRIPWRSVHVQGATYENS